MSHLEAMIRQVEGSRVGRIVEASKQLNTYPGIPWDQFCWDITPYIHSRAHEKRRFNLYFTRHRKNRLEPFIPFAQPFADFAKAIIRTRASVRGVGYKFQKQMITAQRFLYDVMADHSIVDPCALKFGHFQQAATNAFRSSAHRSAYTTGSLLQEISDFVDDHQLSVTRINFQNPIKHPPHSDGLDEESQVKGLEKMPTAQALNALAVASRGPIDDNERILLRVIDLFVVGGFRAGEGLTIPLDCWVEESKFQHELKPAVDSKNKLSEMRVGIRYWPEKGGEAIVKWLPDCAVPLARRAVSDLTRLCRRARKQAALLEQDPSRVPLPGARDANELLDLKQIAKITGLAYSGAVHAFVNQNLRVKASGRRKTTKGRPAKRYRVGDIEIALLKIRAQLQIVKMPNGRMQMLSESLCVMFRNQFRANSATLTFLPELINYKQLSIALGNDRLVPSIFSRRGIVELDKSPMRIKTHAFRHWPNTLAERGGLSDLELALWMGRRDPRQNASYKHGTVAQRVEWAREALEGGKLFGDIADLYVEMSDPIEKRQFLETFVSVAHFTPYGVCLHDFALDPCRYHLSCLSGCGEYMRTKGDAEERKNLRQLRVFTERQLKMAERAMAEQEYGSSNWVQHNRRLLTNADAALAVDDEGTVAATGNPIRVFSSEKTKGRPIW